MVPVINSIKLVRAIEDHKDKYKIRAPRNLKLFILWESYNHTRTLSVLRGAENNISLSKALEKC